MLLLEQLNDVTMDMDVLPYDQGPYPFVILVGPSASSKKSIISSLAEKYPDKVRRNFPNNNNNNNKRNIEMIFSFKDLHWKIAHDSENFRW